MIHVITKFERPSKEAIDNFRKLAVATVYEASGRMGQVNSHIKPIRRGLKICGPAFTVQCHPKDNLMLHKALEIASPGDEIFARRVSFRFEQSTWFKYVNTDAGQNAPLVTCATKS